MKKIIIFSSKEISYITEYCKSNGIITDRMDFYFLNDVYYCQIESNIKNVLEDKNNYILRTASKEVLEKISKLIKNIDISLEFIRLYIKENEIKSVNYNKKEFTECLEEGWEIR